jgi:hypothetical protein
VEGPVSAILSGILYAQISPPPAVVSCILKNESGYPAARVQDIVADIPGDGQEAVKPVGGGISS